MFRLLPWSSAIGGNKVMAEEFKMLAPSPHCTAPSVNALALPHLKRKRADSTDSIVIQEAPVATKLRPDHDNPNPPVAVSQHATTTVNSATVASQGPTHQPLRPSNPPSQSDQHATSCNVNVDQLRETFEAQLSLEVLLKHNELRLIDQEIAKCQVALEQLRRCAEIPYPGSHVAGLSPAVSAGTGASVWAPGNGPAPLSPAPWGVTEGPYTRHYARWLLPDPRFDGGEVEPATPLSAVGTPLGEGRSTRGTSGDAAYLAGKSRPQRGSMGTRLQSLPTGYPPPKEKAGPMIIRRKSDGVMVKLICLDCRRDNFSSTQGFINHCRIAHNRNFASHDAAAVASGEPVEIDEAGTIVGGSKSETPIAVTPGYVHPLVRSAHVIESASKTPSSGSDTPAGSVTPQKRSGSNRQASSTVETPRPLVKPTPSMKTAHDAFTGSPATPHLSSLMQVRGMGIDLKRLVGETKDPVDLSAYSSDEGESDPEPVPPSAGVTHGDKPRIGRQPMRTTVSQAGSQRPSSSKGTDKATRTPLSLEMSTPLRPTPQESAASTRPTDGMDRSLNLSPNTLESNQAPSLVSDDDDDYEAASDSESPGPSSSDAGDHEEDFSHIDVEDDEGTTTGSGGGTTDPKRAPGHPSPSLSRSFGRGSAKKKDDILSASIGPLNRGSTDEKRVSFASPDSSPGKDTKESKRKPGGRN
ncbi:hypothetical protein FE257_010214 [Aspergillus nanangensis]|uniref:AHC1-like C2H2 zinc-finger domain-containing protein n=1 Tax=Aspergillus nanangensis TaxID=2582783 RepID=A0AAD4CJM0_ASPNN|nr:hypothetical protein FE257_010214 [Aspergillus nanangensis]